MRDTVKLNNVLNRYVTRRDTILSRLTDTVRVREFVATADSTIAACRSVVTTCEQRVADRDSLLRIVGRQRIADRERFTAELKRANPRVVPYVEGLYDPFNSTVTARAGLEMRLVGAIRLIGAAQYQNGGDTHIRALAGVRVTF